MQEAESAASKSASVQSNTSHFARPQQEIEAKIHQISKTAVNWKCLFDCHH